MVFTCTTVGTHPPCRHSAPPAEGGPPFLQPSWCGTHLLGPLDHHLVCDQNLVATAPEEPLPKGVLNLMILRGLPRVKRLPVPILHVGHLLQCLPLVLPFPNVLGGLDVILLGCAPQPMLPRVVDDFHFFVSTSKTTKGAAATSAFVRRRVDFTLVQSKATAVELEAVVASTHRYLVGGSSSSSSSSLVGRGRAKKCSMVSCPHAAALGGTFVVCPGLGHGSATTSGS